MNVSVIMGSSMHNICSTRCCTLYDHTWLKQVPDSLPCLCHAKGHTGAVIALAHILVGDTLLVFSSAEDQQVLVWECKLDSGGAPSAAFSEWVLRQKLEVGNGLQHCLAVSSLPDQPEW